MTHNLPNSIPSPKSKTSNTSVKRQTLVKFPKLPLSKGVQWFLTVHFPLNIQLLAVDEHRKHFSTCMEAIVVLHNVFEVAAR